MMERFKNKVALVTGAGSGIGRATALAFAREGARVVVSDVNEDLGAATARAIQTAGGEARFVRCDVSSSAQVGALVAAVEKTYGRLDCAFNNAGISGASAPTGEYPEASWERVIGVNLTGVFLCMKREIEQMVRQGGAGTIVNNASILGTVGFANAPAYVAAKHGVIGLTRTAALEYGSRNLRINAVCPAFIDTPMLAEAGITRDPAVRAAIEAMHPVKRLGSSEEVAAAVLFLASNEASFVTGHPMLVDGGYTAQ